MKFLLIATPTLFVYMLYMVATNPELSRDDKLNLILENQTEILNLLKEESL